MKRFIALLCMTALLCGCGDVDEDSSSEKAVEITSASEEETTAADEDDTQDGWKKAFAEKLSEFRESDEYAEIDGYAPTFSVNDINKDGTKELVIKYFVKNADGEKIMAFRMYTYIEGKLTEVTLPEKCFLNGVTGGGYLYVQTRDDTYTKETYSFCTLERDVLSVKEKLEIQLPVNDSEESQYFIDGRQVEPDEYSAEYQKLNGDGLLNAGDDFGFSDEVIAAALGNSTDWKQAYSALLCEKADNIEGVTDLTSSVDEAGFSIVDVTGDDTPELIVSEGGYHASFVTVYSYTDRLISYGQMGSYGTIGYYPEIGEIFCTYSGMGYTSGSYLKLDSSGNRKIVFMYSDDEGAISPENGEEASYTIDCVDVDKSEYEAKVYNYAKGDMYWLGTDNKLNAENAKAVAEGKYTEPVVAESYIEDPADNEMPDEYRSVLSAFYYGCHLDVVELDIDAAGNMSDNQFAVCDVDGDGADELIINVTETSMAEMVSVVYGINQGGEVFVEMVTSPTLTFYDNGMVMAEALHNQGNAGDFWPYTAYEYDSDNDVFNETAYVNAWDKNFREEGYPSEADTSGSGFVYYISKVEDRENAEPVDSSVYEKWYDEKFGNALPLQIPYQSITEENISAN